MKIRPAYEIRLQINSVCILQLNGPFSMCFVWKNGWLLTGWVWIYRWHEWINAVDSNFYWLSRWQSFYDTEHIYSNSNVCVYVCARVLNRTNTKIDPIRLENFDANAIAHFTINHTNLKVLVSIWLKRKQSSIHIQWAVHITLQACL